MCVCGGDELGCHADVELLVAGAQPHAAAHRERLRLLDLHEAENSP